MGAETMLDGQQLLLQAGVRNRDAERAPEVLRQQQGVEGIASPVTEPRTALEVKLSRPCPNVVWACWRGGADRMSLGGWGGGVELE